MSAHPTDSDDNKRLIASAISGNTEALAQLMDCYRGRLTRMVGMRMDHRLQGRVDASDIVQEAMIDASRRLEEYAANPRMGFYLWLRCLAGDRLINAYQHHLGTQKRDASQEVAIYRRAMPQACSVSLAAQLLGKLTSPTQAIAKAELQLIVQEVLNAMDPIDREILVLRSFEQLSTTETAEVLGIKRSTASKRYLTALKRLKQALSAIPGIKDHLN